MKEQNTSLRENILLLYLSWFGVGYTPRAPGTFGTLAALPLLWWLQRLVIPVPILALAITLMTILACLAADHIQRLRNLQDPQWIVVDEVIGMSITWLIVLPQTPLEWALAFAVFRFFDIVKIWPASYFDKKVKNGAGTILDDVISGVFAGIFVYVIAKYFLRN
jgi:phosphatidylglycerophosphatase A